MSHCCSLVFVGDVMPGRLSNYTIDELVNACGSRIFNDETELPNERSSENSGDQNCIPQQRSGARSVNVLSIGKEVRDFMAKATFRMCNFEGFFCNTRTELNDLILYPETFLSKHEVSPSAVDFMVHCGFNCVSLANNHVLDGGMESMKTTVSILNDSNIKWVGFGRNLATAWKPRIISLGMPGSNAACKDSKMGGARETCIVKEQEVTDPTTDSEFKMKVAIFCLADHFKEWRATRHQPGINFFDITNFCVGETNPNWDSWVNFEHISEEISKVQNRVDVVIFSIHWGDNFVWIPSNNFINFAHLLIDNGVLIVFGHSSHHVQGIEYYNGGLIIYGAGDFINDYDMFDVLLRNSGSSLGQEYINYRSDLSFAYRIVLKNILPEDPASGLLNSNDLMPTEGNKNNWHISKLELLPTKINNGHIGRPNQEDITWLVEKVSKLSSQLGQLEFERKGDFLVAEFGQSI